jgi:transcriptional regulator with PAS, ATPase and Fis domain
MAEHEELYDEARADRLREMLRHLASLITELDREGALLASSAELQRLLGDARSELFHYEVRSTYDTPELAERRRLVDEARAQGFTIDEPEDDEPWRPRPPQD